MAEALITDVFGAAFTQNATTLTIAKADLDFTATATNKADVAVAGIFKKWANNLTQAAFNADFDRSIYITPSFESVVTRTIGSVTNQYLHSTWNIVFAKSLATSGITPNDY